MARVYLLIEISDNGWGMPKSQADAGFSRFGEIRLELQGSSLWLFLAKKMVLQPGATIDLEEKVGTTLVIFFPKLILGTIV